MASLSIPAGKTVYTTRYTDFKGVDYSTTDECVDSTRFSDCDNLMFDKAGLIEKRLGFRCLSQLEGEIHSMKSVCIDGKNELLIHAGTKLYKYDGSTVTAIKKEGYKRYSAIFQMPTYSSDDTNGDITARQVAVEIIRRATDSCTIKVKNVFMIKISNTIVNAHSGKTNEEIKSILDGKSISELEKYYRDLTTNPSNQSDGINSILYPEYYFNNIKNGRFADGIDGWYKWSGSGTDNVKYETYAESLKMLPLGETATIYQKKNTASNEWFYITFLGIGDDAGYYLQVGDEVKYSKTGTQRVGVLVIFSDSYKITTDDTSNYYADIGDGKSSINIFDNKVWISSENGFYAYDGISVMEASDLSYAPVTVALRNMNYTHNKATGTLVTDYNDTEPGSALEGVNLLTRKRINTFALSHFCTQFSTSEYSLEQYSELTLDTSAASVERIEILTGNGNFEELDKRLYSVSGNKVKIKRHIYFQAGGNNMSVLTPAPYILDGVTENLKVYFTATTPSGYEKKVDKCHISAMYGVGRDDRLFVCGNEKYPNYIWYSEFENFSYMPDINYIVTGDSTTKNLGFTKVNQNLLVHKEGNDQDTTVFMITGSLDGDGKAIFTVAQGINGVGAISEKGFANFDDMPMFLSDKGVYSVVSTNIISEKTVVNRSAYINNELLKHDLKNAAMISYDDMLLVAAGGYIYVLYPRKQSYYGKDTVYNAASFECLRWSGLPADVLCVYNGGLYFGTHDGRLFKWNNDIEGLSKYDDVLTPGADGQAVKCYFVTKLDDDGSFMTLKTMVKRGCGIMIKPYTQSSVKVYTLTEKEHAKLIKEEGAAIFSFDEFWFNVVDFSSREVGRIIPFNAKVKKYSALCFRVENDALSQGFGVIGIEKRYTVGNYKKY